MNIHELLSKVEQTISLFPFLPLGIWSIQELIGMITQGFYGSYGLFFPCYVNNVWSWTRYVRGTTVLWIVICYVVTFLLFSHKRPFIQSSCAGIFTLVGLVHFEFWWQVGLEYSYNFERIYVYEVLYWGAFTMCLLMFLYYLHIYWKILDLSKIRIIVFCICYAVFMVTVYAVSKSGFYQQFVLYASGVISDDPHNIIMARCKLIGMLIWIPLYKWERNKRWKRC